MRRSTWLVALMVAALCPLSGRVLAAEKQPGWQPLMDGKTLKGWHKVGDGEWTVEDGAFVGRANKTKLYGLLVSDATFKDLTVRFKFKVLDGDSGFYIRTVIKDPDQAHGLQIQVGKPKSGVGGIYESYGRAWIAKPTVEQEEKLFRADAWNEMQITARGGDVEVQFNGVVTAKLSGDPSPPSGHLALQMHSGNVMHVMFKDIEIMEH